MDVVVAAYTCPLWHPSRHYERIYRPGWTEYELMTGAQPWFPGHAQPRHPLLGALDEQDPQTWEVYNDLAADHGVDVLLWDWYWYEGEPAMHEALEDGFLRARNRDRVRFAVMWTNHSWMVLFPTTQADGAARFRRVRRAPDAIEDVWRSLSYVVARYFHLPGYWHIDGKPVLVVWDGSRLCAKLGRTLVRELLAELRAYARRLGHDGIHLHHDCTLAAAYAPGRVRQVVGELDELGYDTCGLYAPIVVSALRRPAEPLPDYEAVAAVLVDEVWPEVEAAGAPLPFLPSVGPGWDTSPRSARAGDGSVPPGTIVVGETPAAFEALVRAGLAYLNDRPATPPVLTIGCWNEWTEGQYLLPDTRFGDGMLRALSRARGREPAADWVDSPAGDVEHLAPPP